MYRGKYHCSWVDSTCKYIYKMHRVTYMWVYLSPSVCAYKQQKENHSLKVRRLLKTSDLVDRSDGEGRRERKRESYNL